MVSIQIGKAGPVKALSDIWSACNAVAVYPHSLDELVHLFSATNVEGDEDFVALFCRLEGNPLGKGLCLPQDKVAAF